MNLATTYLYLCARKAAHNKNYKRILALLAEILILNLNMPERTTVKSQL